VQVSAVPPGAGAADDPAVCGPQDGDLIDEEAIPPGDAVPPSPGAASMTLCVTRADVG
jgi:hypothetical protein